MKKRLAAAACVCAFAALALCTRQVIQSAGYALQLCAGLILPTLFPFFVISILLNRMGIPAWLGKLLSPSLGRLFGVSGSGISALLIGLTGGYPMGAAYIADMLDSGHIDSDEAEHLLCFCNNSGPAFILSAVGAGVFESPKAGFLLYLVHIAAAVITGLLMRRKGNISRSSAVHIESINFSAAFPAAVRQAVVSALNVCGFVVCFTVLAGLLDSAGFISSLCGFISINTGLELHWCRAMFMGFLELGSGAGAMQGLTPSPLNMALAAAMLGWGGLSVHFQTMALLSESSAKGALHTAGRLMSASISAVLAYFAAFML